MVPPVSSAKLAARAGVLLVNMRATGFSSRPPLARLARVTKKSAVAHPAVAAKSVVFSRSQKRCGTRSVDVGLVTINGVAGSSAGLGASTTVEVVASKGPGESWAVRTEFWAESEVVSKISATAMVQNSVRDVVFLMMTLVGADIVL